MYDGKQPSREWVILLMKKMELASFKDAPAPPAVPFEVVNGLLRNTTALLKQRPVTVVDLDVPCPSASLEDPSVKIVGDTHGHFHDLLHLFELSGLPSESSYFIFNGDFVDRGAWGLEVMLTLMTWKLALPESVTLLRGNHETAYCTAVYGFQAELKYKYGFEKGTDLHNRFLSMFQV
ncbi:hypothetical protein CYMTET_22138 [Cymbomonas tetramitiformis]|uniref:Serine/threonine-protein phosphatase n=1 Tax=Cymbomonas tetramitiformis TaxID=36881 RepID=A0AAE0L2H5_9CHLO|nr:hypothetical protein CYMTET_22138 [Cymbomonas tetramitiformis]